MPALFVSASLAWLLGATRVESVTRGRRLGRSLTLVASPTTVRLLDGSAEVASHLRSYDRHELVEDPAHRQALLEEKRKTLGSTPSGLLAALIPESQAFLAPLGHLPRLSAHKSGPAPCRSWLQPRLLLTLSLLNRPLFKFLRFLHARRHSSSRAWNWGPSFRSAVLRFPVDDPHYRILARQRSRYTHYYFYLGIQLTPVTQ